MPYSTASSSPEKVNAELCTTPSPSPLMSCALDALSWKLFSSLTYSRVSSASLCRLSSSRAIRFICVRSCKCFKEKKRKLRVNCYSKLLHIFPTRAMAQREKKYWLLTLIIVHKLLNSLYLYKNPLGLSWTGFCGIWITSKEGGGVGKCPHGGLDKPQKLWPQRWGRGRGWEVSSRRLDMPQKLFVDCTLSTPFSHDLHIGRLKTASRLLGT